MRTSRWALAGALAVTGTVLAGCEQPPPSVTVFSGSTSVRTAALCWAFDAPALRPGDCAQDIVAGSQVGDAPQLRVSPGNVVGISVDEAVAQEGWVPAIGGQRLVNTPITDTYYRFTFPQAELPAQGLGLQVLAGSGNQLRGVWAVRLTNS